MIKTPLSTVIGGVGMYTKNSLIIGGKTEPPFDPKSLFGNGEQGFYIDPNTLEGVGQTVATIPDLSSNNNHASNTNSAQQALLSVNSSTGYKYLNFDGTDDFYATPAFALPKPFTLIIALEQTKESGTQALFSGGYGGYVLISTGFSVQQTSGNPSLRIAKQNKDVFIHKHDGLKVTLKNSIAEASSLELVADNPYSNNSKKFIANFNDTTFTTVAGIKLYAMLVINRALTDEEEAAVRKEFNKRMGIKL